MMDYYYKMMNKEEINLVQQILFLKGYSWVTSGKSIIFASSKEPQWVMISPRTKTLFSVTFDPNTRSLEFNQLLDLIESDAI